jgi:hypothetical protein
LGVTDSALPPTHRGAGSGCLSRRVSPPVWAFGSAALWLHTITVDSSGQFSIASCQCRAIPAGDRSAHPARNRPASRLRTRVQRVGQLRSLGCSQNSSPPWGDRRKALPLVSRRVRRWQIGTTIAGWALREHHPNGAAGGLQHRGCRCDRSGATANCATGRWATLSFASACPARRRPSASAVRNIDKDCRPRNHPSFASWCYLRTAARLNGGLAVPRSWSRMLTAPCRGVWRMRLIVMSARPIGSTSAAAPGRRSDVRGCSASGVKVPLKITMPPRSLQASMPAVPSTVRSSWMMVAWSW